VRGEGATQSADGRLRPSKTIAARRPSELAQGCFSRAVLRCLQVLVVGHVRTPVPRVDDDCREPLRSHDDPDPSPSSDVVDAGHD